MELKLTRRLILVISIISISFFISYYTNLTKEATSKKLFDVYTEMAQMETAVKEKVEVQYQNTNQSDDFILQKQIDATTALQVSPEYKKLQDASIILRQNNLSIIYILSLSILYIMIALFFVEPITYILTKWNLNLEAHKDYLMNISLKVFIANLAVMVALTLLLK